MISIAVISGFALALLAPAIHRVKPAWSGAILALLPLYLFIFFLSYIPEVSRGAEIVESVAWAPHIGVTFSFYLDGLSLVFALLVTGIGTLIIFYSGGYLHGHPNLGRFHTYMLGFMASMLGLVLASNVISLFIFWELTSLSSYFLIGFDHHRESARSAALQALLVTGIGGLALLAGLILLGMAGGSQEMYELLDRGEVVRSHQFLLPMLILLLAGAFTKSAQTPFHFWLPSAMEGPAPVSAYLHSATMVKAGVYLVLRLSPVFTGAAAWHTSLALFGGITMITGAWLAIVQTDMKKLLAYTTVNGLGMLVFLTGLGTPLALQAAVVFLIAHALYKGSLFLSAGVVDHETGSRDVRKLRGLYRRLPLITVASVLAGMSMAGLPPLVGFLGKELIYETVLATTGPARLAAAAALLANALLLAATGVLLLRPFFRPPAAAAGSGHRVSIDLWLGPLAPAAVGLVFGLIPKIVSQSLIAPAASAAAARHVETHLALWHGFTPMLGLSLVTIALGCIVYIVFISKETVVDRWRWIGSMGPDRWYAVGLDGLKALAHWQTRLLQSGYLHHYVLTIVLTAVALTAVTMFHLKGFVIPLTDLNVRVYELVIVVLMILAALMAVCSKSRLSAIVAMGVIGYGLALMFVDFGAPDLAMTQFIIETMTVILFVLVIYRLPRYRVISSRSSRLLNALVATASGALMTILVLVAHGVREGSQLSAYFAENSLLLAHGRNVVNVIIVDFRAMDTLGEITVLSLAGIGVYTLLKLRPHPGGADEQEKTDETTRTQESKEN
jgi:multicomponent Na+:H+ antiporter subunit A